MTYGVTKERKLQIGQESSAGTQVVATTIWRGPANSILDNRSVVHPDENVGYSSMMSRIYTPSVGAEYNLPDTEITFEQGPFIMAASTKSLVSGVANGGTGGTAGYIYAYPLPATYAAHTFKTLTLEAGNNNLAHYLGYGFCDKWGISGAPKQALKWKGVHFFGQQRTVHSFTSLSTPPTVEEILFGNGKLYVDSTLGSIGGTQATGSWLGFNLTADTGLRPINTGDGQLYFNFVKPTGYKLTGDLTIEDSSLATATETDWVAKTIKLIRMSFAGTSFGNSGSPTYPGKILVIDLACAIDKIDVLASDNGNDTKKVSFTVVNSLADSLFGSITFANALSVLP